MIYFVQSNSNIIEVRMVDSKAMLFILFALFYTSMAVSSWTNEYYIPSSIDSKTYYIATNCVEDNRTCHTLRYYMQNQAVFFKSDTTFVFQHGYHVLDVNASLIIQNVSRLFFQGHNATINCSGNYFSFESFQTLQIVDLHFLHCGHLTIESSGRASLNFTNGRNLTLKNIILSSSVYQALLIDNVLGSTSILGSLVEKCCVNSHFQNTSSAVVKYSACSNQSSLLVKSTIFEGNFNSAYDHHWTIDQSTSLSMPLAGGLTISLTFAKVNVTLDNITLNNNRGGNGGNLAVIIHMFDLSTAPLVSINNSFIVNGTALEGGGLFLSVLQTALKEPSKRLREDCNEICQSIIKIESTHFINNTALFGGGALAIQQKESKECSSCGSILIRHCKFLSNSLQKGGGGATAINSVNFITTGIFSHVTPQFQISVMDCSFTKNFVSRNKWNSSGSSVIFVKSNPYFELNSVTIDSNNSTAILGTETNLVFSGNVTLSNNNASSGGGLLLCQNAVMFLTPGVVITIINNYAEHTGGGIAVESVCLISRPICFFQLASSNPKDYDDVHIHIYNNTAKHAGDNLYGGSVEYCYMIDTSSQNIPANQSISVYKRVFHIYPQEPGTPYVTSSPTHVCLCENGIPICNISHYEKHDPVYPGQPFTFEAVLVGQLNGAVPGIVEIWMTKKLPSLDNQKFPKTEQKNCSNFSYSLNTNRVNGYEKINIAAAQQGDTSVTNHLRQYRKVQLTLSVKNCPKGFKLSPMEPYICVCDEVLKKFNVSCNISNQSIASPKSMWIGYANRDSYSFISKETTLVQTFCPFDYCYCEHIITIPTSDVKFNEDRQCANQRTGIMCGACRDGFSLKLGGSECRKCTNQSLYLLLLFALAGILLVFVLTVLNITVSDGMINGLLFYTNIVQVQQPFFFNVKHNSLTNFLRIFIAWLNLDLGFSMCFYKGMDEYSKAWLQFVFPLYIWIILGVIIFLSRRCNMVTRLVGRNAVKIFATLILLSYPKLLRAIIASMSPSFLDAADKATYTVWTIDGNVPFLQGKHIVLFIFALLLAVICFPFILSLLFIQVLERYSHYRIFFFIRKFKPLFDAYTGPYSGKGRFWTGLLLVTRLGIFIISSSTLTKSAADIINTVTIMASTFLSLIAWILRPGIYKKTSLDILECTSLFNLVILSVCTMYARNNDHDQTSITNVSVGTAFITFMGVISYHVLKVLYSIDCVKSRVKKLKKSLKCLKRQQRDVYEPRNVNSLVQDFPPFVQFTEDREPLLAEDAD